MQTEKLGELPNAEETLHFFSFNEAVNFNPFFSISFGFQAKNIQCLLNSYVNALSVSQLYS